MFINRSKLYLGAILSISSIVLVIVLAIHLDKKRVEMQELATLKLIESLEAPAANSDELDDEISDINDDNEPEDVIILE